MVNIIPLNPRIDTAQPFASPPPRASSFNLLLLIERFFEECRCF